MKATLSESELTELFRRLGARSPELWAHSQVTEGFPQLARFLFLTQAWSKVVTEGDALWIEDAIHASQARPDSPYAGLGTALARCKAAGVTTEDLTEIARCVQAQLLFHIAYLLEGSQEYGVDVSWALFETNQDGTPTDIRICGLHESVLETDPTGREMRPKIAGVVRG